MDPHHEHHNHAHHDMMMPMNSTCDPKMHMRMFFHFDYCETVLFENWQITSLTGLLVSMLGIFIMAVLYEGIKYFREYLFWQAFHTLQYRTVTLPEKNANGASTDEPAVRTVGEVVHKQPPTMFSIVHVIQTLLHIVQIVLSYFLMLIFMTFNVWLCTAVTIGAAVGYFLFGWKKSVIVDVTEHCH